MLQTTLCDLQDGGLSAPSPAPRLPAHCHSHHDTNGLNLGTVSTLSKCFSYKSCCGHSDTWHHKIQAFGTKGSKEEQFLQIHCGSDILKFLLPLHRLALESGHFLKLPNTVPLVVLDANLAFCQINK